MRSVLSAVLSLRGGSKVGSLSVSPVRPSTGQREGRVEEQDVLLITATETADADTTDGLGQGQGHGYRPAAGRERERSVEAVSQVLLLDSSLRVLAVLRNDCSGSEGESESSISTSAGAVDMIVIPESNPPLDSGLEDISGTVTVTVSRDLKLKGEGAAVTVMGAGAGTRMRKGSTPSQPAPVIVTSACLVPHPHRYSPHTPSRPHSLSCSVAVITAFTADSSRHLSNKFLLWHPHWHPHTDDLVTDGRADPDPRSDGAQSTDICHDDLISSLAVSGSDLPFNNTPPLSSSKNAFGGSTGQHMLLAARGTGLRQQVVLGDFNGHVWGATLGPDSDFPGPMYPPGFTLMQRVRSYLESEDELDYPVHATATGAGTGASSGAAAGSGLGSGPGAGFSPVLQLEPLECVPITIPFIDVGVCPLYCSSSRSSSSSASRDAALSLSLSLTISRSRCDEHAYKRDQRQEQEHLHNVSFRLTQRLPMRLVGEVRARFLEQKTRALMLRKASMARARSSTAALKRKAPSSSTHRTAWKKKKKSYKGTAAARAGRAGDGCSVSDAGSSLHQDAQSLGTAKQQLQLQEGVEEVTPMLVAPTVSPLTPVPLEGSEMEGEGDTYIEEGDAEQARTSLRHGRGTKRRRPETTAEDRERERDSEESSQSENEGEETEGGPDPDPALLLTLVEEEGEGEGGDGTANVHSSLSLSLCDVLPVPRRVLTGDFALRILKRKEVPFCIIVL